ncbi:amino acid adenylation domain-containing protein [Streptomyces sp. NPDC001351]|uniref:amino acid adenylation domain-containing protein n=1 Tax=Streptomyces sp. NPDC001351 TaxID=3364564 RepID=UPI003673E581
MTAEDAHVIVRVARQAARTPRAVAVVDHGEDITYAELVARAATVARRVELHTAPGSVVAVRAPRSADGVAAMLGVWWAGCTYLALDPRMPAARLSAMLASSGAKAVVVASEVADHDADVPIGDLPVIAVTRAGDTLGTDDVAGQKRAAAGPAVAPRPTADILYLVYTSGSTGVPKGVQMGESAFRGLVEWHEAEGGRPGQRTALFAAVGFDVAFQEIAATLCTGGTLVVIDEPVRRDPARLLAELRRNSVHRLFLPTAALQLLAEQADPTGEFLPLTLADVICAGDQLRITPAVRCFFARLDGCRLHNHYGPAETHVVTSWTASGPPTTWPDTAPIGTPLPHVEVEIADGAGGTPPSNGPGELVVYGVRVGRGYVGRPDLTAERFISGPRRGYRTGDLVEWRDGVLVFRGRRDRQVKVDGFRVEPDEVESHLAQHPGVAECAVDAETTESGTTLVGYVVPRADRLVAPLASRQLRAFLRGRLPAYMVPLRFHEVSAIPMTVNGKLDRDALRGLVGPPRGEDPAAQDRATPVAERQSLEALVRGAYAEALGHDDIRVDENFFELGGTSLRAAQVRAALGRTLGKDVPIVLLYDHPTARALAAALEPGSTSAPPDRGRGGQISARASARADRRTARREGRRGR